MEDKGLIKRIILPIALSILLFIFIINSMINQEKLIVTVRFDLEQLTKLEKISKKDFRDVKHTLLMLADDYIKYHEKDEEVTK